MTANNFVINCYQRDQERVAGDGRRRALSRMQGQQKGSPNALLDKTQTDRPRHSGRHLRVWVGGLSLLAFLTAPPPPLTAADAATPAFTSTTSGESRQAKRSAARSSRVQIAQAGEPEMSFGPGSTRHLSTLMSPKIANQIAKYEKAVHVNPRNASAWNKLGHLRLRTGDAEGAKRAYHAVLKLGLYHGNREVQAAAYANLGIVYKTAGDLDRAQLAHQKALKLNTRIGRRDRMADAYINLGVIHQAKGDYQDAIDAQLKALAINKQLGNREGMANAYGNLGVVYKLTGELLKAETSLTSSLTIKEHLGDREGVAKAYANLGSIYKSRGNIDEACRLWSRAHGEFGAVNHRPWKNTVRSWMAETSCNR